MASSISTYALLLTFFTTLISFFFITSRSKQKFRNRKKLPPGPRPQPIIGNLHMLGQLPYRSLSNLAKKYGSIMSIRLGNVPTIVVSSPEAAELVLKIHDVVFASRPKLQFADYVSYGNKGLAFAPYRSFWRTVRKWCTLQLLSSSKVELFEPIRRREMESLVDRIKRAAASGQVVDLSAKAVELMENIMYRMIIGRSKDDKFDLRPLIQQALRLSGHFNIADYVPFLAPLDLQVSL
ncbi:hypothetical protein Gohar_002943, partial [Gossypium harknessii]|nr:hypothetical protein [Gossypium harknessii]